jgi:hypothetical protein
MYSTEFYLLQFFKILSSKIYFLMVLCQPFHNQTIDQHKKLIGF